MKWPPYQEKGFAMVLMKNPFPGLGGLFIPAAQFELIFYHHYIPKYHMLFQHHMNNIAATLIILKKTQAGAFVCIMTSIRETGPHHEVR